MSEATEGIKHDDLTLRFDLLPIRPLMELVRVYTIGSFKYADRNWEKGLKWCRLFSAMMRHSWKWFFGEKYDRKDGQHHLASVAWYAFALMEFEYTHTELDDRPKFTNEHIQSFLEYINANLKSNPNVIGPK